jgi:hypothetical protein
MSGPGPEIQRLSWRDPDGFVVNAHGRILRAVAPAKAAQIRSLLEAPWIARLIAEGVLPRTVETSDPPQLLQDTGDWVWLEHDLLPFPCHAHEITALQLYDAGDLTLDIAIEAAANGWVLKDASAWNVLFSKGRPWFVDLLSFDRLDSTGTWIAYGQFVRHFILPLLLYRKLGITPPEVFLIHRDGVAPERAYELLRGAGLMSATALEFVVLPKLLTRAGSRLIAAQSAGKARVPRAAIGEHLLLNTLRRMKRTLKALRPDETKTHSAWKSYEEERTHYSAADLAVKTEFVREGIKDSKTVLDLGCNAGEFSLLAAECGKAVVAADADHAALSRMYARIRGHDTGVSPIMLNLGRPSPAVGWQNKEVRSFLDRAAGQFDCILLLGDLAHAGGLAAPLESQVCGLGVG